ncbi:BRCT domain-containing protein [Phanerochaete sordida]|uniref:BRCT domain-containing protein n=1 Tax=Phanerochaete sordida TaxID=48140 RepID=A0A9P3FZX2_9APHY|nr:BRCT domain-containing protein [Phanerochaete sordida]
MVFRRGNKSNKVPNVKLRPAQPQAAKRPQPEPGYSVDSGFDSNQDSTQSFIDVCPRPFKSVVICATGISDKTTLFKQAIELGAQPLNDLTDKVTHLLATEPGSAKYKCALECRIPVMHPDWITESYKIWLRGDDVNLEESVRDYRLPVFEGVVLCVSGIEDVAKRTEINRIVTTQGGSYVKNIERPVRVTHLICAPGADEPSEKMLYAAKFNARKEADICIVWEQWFWDCVRVQGMVDEARYDVSRPPPAPLPEPEAEPPRAEPVPADGGPAHGARAADGLDGDADDDEPARALKRVPAVTLQIWQSMLQPRGFALQAGRLVRSPSRSQAAPLPASPVRPHASTARADSDAAERDGARESGERPSVLRGLSKSASFAPAPRDASTPRPFARASSNIFAAPPDVTVLAQGGADLPVASSSRVASEPVGDDGPVEVAVEGEGEAGEGEAGIFAGKTFRTLGEARSAPVRQALEAAGGRVVREDEDEEVDFVIVRLVSGSKLYREEHDPVERAKYRTECWLERCLFEERICPPEDHVSFTPIPVPIPIDGTEHISLSFSGLDESEACWVRRLARALGMALAPAFSRRTTHLLCPARTGAKFDKAREWAVPVVDMAWLAGVARTGAVPPWARRRVSAGDVSREGSAARAPARKQKGKGKERAPPGEAGLVDITNGRSSFGFGVTSWQADEGDEAPPAAVQDASRAPSPPPPPSPRRQSSPLGSADYTDAHFGDPVGLLDESVTEPEVEPHLIPGLDAEPGAMDASRAPSETRSLADLREDMLHTTIASSRSPSPLKVPTPFRSPARRRVADAFAGELGVVDADGTAREPRTPSRVSRAESDELQARLASLLGKRPAEDVPPDAAGDADADGPAVKRRARALSAAKSKDAHAYQHFFERSTSGTSIVLDDAPLPTPRELDLDAALDDPVRRQPSPGPARRARTPSAAGGGVAYVDPAQQQHRARLMSLLGPEAAGGAAAPPPEDDWSALLMDAAQDAEKGRGAKRKEDVPEPKRRPRRSAARRR